jgi:putative transposase
MLTEKITEIHKRSRGTYGAPRIHAELKDMGIRVGENRVARLMRAAGFQGVTRRKGVATTAPSPSAAAAPDLVGRDFEAKAPNELWVADITYVPTGSGFLYLSVVLDAFSRRAVGWAMASHLRTELVLAALEMALTQRSPEEVIHHSDRGSQYTSIAFGKRCEQEGVRPSMGATCYDNALCESFTTGTSAQGARRFATLECELIDRERFECRGDARLAIFQFIESWYNPHRRHSALDYKSPNQYEENYQTGAEKPQLLTIH